MGGLALSILAHLLLDGVDLVWRDGVFPWLAVLAAATAFLSLVRTPLTEHRGAAPLTEHRGAAPLTEHRGAAPLTEPAVPATEHDGAVGEGPASGRVWFLCGPTLLLAGLAATSWAKAAAGPAPASWEAALLVFALAAATALALRQPLPPLLGAPVGVLLVGAAFGVLWLPTGGSVAGAVAIVCLGCLLPAAAGGPARRPGVAVLGGGLFFLVATFAYYAAYDLDLGFPNQAGPVAVAVVVAVLAAAPSRRQRPRPAPEPGRGAGTEAGTGTGTGTGSWSKLGAKLGVVVVLAVLAVAASWRATPQVQAAQGDTIKLITYNIRMGFGLDGRLSLDDIAAWAAAQRPDVVLLSEVDRGWLLNGGHDDLARIARGLGMRYHFAPAADNVWGDALLTNLPVRHVRSHPLGAHGYPTGAQAQAIVLEVGGEELGIVNTHLQAPDEQAAEVAAIVRDLAAGSGPASAPGGPAGTVRPVILAGDLNTRPGDPAMRVLEAAGLSDPLIALGDPPTSPAEAPVERIDHVLVSEGLIAMSAQAPRVPYSDHLPVLTTLRITSVDQEG